MHQIQQQDVSVNQRSTARVQLCYLLQVMQLHSVPLGTPDHLSQGSVSSVGIYRRVSDFCQENREQMVYLPTLVFNGL